MQLLTCMRMNGHFMIPDMLKNIGRNEAFSEIITNNREMYSVFQYIESIAHSTQPILITGETGVGKELIARCIHRVSSRITSYNVCYTKLLRLLSDCSALRVVI